MCKFCVTEVGRLGGGLSWAFADSLHPRLPPTVVFPQDLLEKGLEADNFAMLGLGDIVIPGDGDGVGAAVQVVEGLKGGAGAL